MKKNLALLLLSIFMVACNSNNSGSQSVTDSFIASETPAESTIEKDSITNPSRIDNYNLDCTLTNNNLTNPRYKIGEIEKEIVGGKFNITGLHGDEKVEIFADGYIDEIINVEDYLGDKEDIEIAIELAKDYKLLGRTIKKTWKNYVPLYLYASRTSSFIYIKVNGTEKSWLNTGDSQIEVYFSTGLVPNRENDACLVYKNNNSNDHFSLHFESGIAISTKGVGFKKTIGDEDFNLEFKIPYEKLRIQNDDVFGLSLMTWDHDVSDYTNIVVAKTGGTVEYKDPKTFVRFDKDNNFFENPYNCQPADNPINQEELAAGFPIKFAIKDVNHKDADDIYVKVTKNSDSFLFDMLGFGDFKDDEYVKTIVHVGNTKNSNIWGLLQSDVSIISNKEKAYLKTGDTDYWSFTPLLINQPGVRETTIKPEFTQFDKYFRYRLTIKLSEIPNYSSSHSVYATFAEFCDGIIYNENVTNGLLFNGINQGDMALQSNYVKIQTVDLDPAIYEGYPYRFATTGDDIRAKITRDNVQNKIELEFIASGDIADTSYIRFMFKENAKLASSTEAWSLLESDYSFFIYKDKAYFTTNKTSFWDAEHQGFYDKNDVCKNTPTYVYNDEKEYFTLKFEFSFEEGGIKDGDSSTVFLGMFIEFKQGVISNDYINNAFSYFYPDGRPGKDPAFQINYFEF